MVAASSTAGAKVVSGVDTGADTGHVGRGGAGGGWGWGRRRRGRGRLKAEWREGWWRSAPLGADW
jgi:hypothetical protein